MRITIADWEGDDDKAGAGITLVRFKYSTYFVHHTVDTMDKAEGWLEFRHTLFERMNLVCLVDPLNVQLVPLTGWIGTTCWHLTDGMVNRTIRYAVSSIWKRVSTYLLVRLCL